MRPEDPKTFPAETSLVVNPECLRSVECHLNQANVGHQLKLNYLGPLTCLSSDQGAAVVAAPAGALADKRFPRAPGREGQRASC